MSSRYQIVVQGEASETDSDDEVYITSMSAPQTATLGAKVSLAGMRLCLCASSTIIRVSTPPVINVQSDLRVILDAVRFPGRRLKQTVRVRRSRRAKPLH